MNKVYVAELIVCEKERRGTGKCKSSPIREVLQIYTKDGNLLAEYDRLSSPIEVIVDFIKYHYNDHEEQQKKIDAAYEYFVKPEIE